MGFEIIFLSLGIILYILGIIEFFNSRINLGTTALFLIGGGLIFSGLVIDTLHLWVILLIFVLILIYAGLIIWIYSQGLKDTATFTEDVVMVLGERLRGDKLSSDLESRLRCALGYYHKNPDCLIVVSGGNGNDGKISEAVAMERYLLKAGVPKEKILKEDKSKTTKENMVNTKQILENRSEKNCKVALITSSYHILRAKMNAKAEGFEDITTIHSKTKWYSVLPNGSREIMGILAYKIFNYA